MDFTEINSRGKREELMGRVDRQNSRFRTAKTIITKFGLHASFAESQSAKNFLNESLVYADKSQTLDHLEDNIRRVIADIRPQMLEKVIENLTSRFDYIRASHGSPMPEIIFKIDEAHFWLNGYVNKQNCRIWSEANRQVYVETPLHPEKLTVWCALWAGGILLQKR
ncbi:hypothetical protein TNCV_2246191 [Trichonephila clavipes]|uniref:Uncharacterized protein n=1 Tax=Trichonephila clavipes TaxID=2585209 RepID=A0A8X6V1K9_TRICX|nr:hypothetical protein TNCV_2246191 [Trichonephila clavipes]